MTFEPTGYLYTRHEGYAIKWEIRSTVDTFLAYLQPVYELCCPYNRAVGVTVQYNRFLLHKNNIKQVLNE
jgi:hypothetical protein